MRLTQNQFDGGGDTLPANPTTPIAPTADSSASSSTPSYLSTVAPAGAATGYASGASSVVSKPQSVVKKNAPVAQGAKFNKDIKVSQSTVDAVKKQGMKEALKEVKAYANQSVHPNATMREGGEQMLKTPGVEATRRLYGSRADKIIAGVKAKAGKQQAAITNSTSGYANPKAAGNKVATTNPAGASGYANPKAAGNKKSTEAARVTSQASGYQNPKASKLSTEASRVTSQPSGYANPKAAGNKRSAEAARVTSQPSGYQNPKAAGNKKKK